MSGVGTDGHASETDLLRAEASFDATDRPDVLILACGAIAREVLAVIRLNGWNHVDVRCLPAKLHNTPQKIAGAVDAKLTERRGPLRPRVRRLRRLRHGRARWTWCWSEHGVDRLPGAHCYGFLAGNDAWDAMHEERPGDLLPDRLPRAVISSALVVRGLKLDIHPELVPMMFGNYRRLVYLAQTDDPSLRLSVPRPQPTFLGLAFEHAAPGTATCEPSLVGSSTAGALDGLS